MHTKPTPPVAIHAEVSQFSIITDFSDGSFTQEFFRPEIKSLAPPKPVTYAPQPYPKGRYTGTCHCAH
jgi:hypothetical protein